MRHLVEALDGLDAAVAQRPELRRERAGRRLQQRRQVDVVGAEAHAELAQRAARRPGRGSSSPRRRASAPARRALRRPGRRCRARCPSSPSPVSSSISGPSSFLTCWAEPQVEAALHRLERRAGQVLVGERRGRAAPAACRRPRAWPTGSPSQRIVPSLASTKASSTAALNAVGPRLDLARRAPSGRPR